MSFLKAVADKFRSAPPAQKVDRYGVLSPLLATGDYVSSTLAMIKVLKTVTPHTNKFALQANSVYADYLRRLGSHEQSMEKTDRYSSMVQSLEAVSQNLAEIEDNFQLLFGAISNDHPEQNLKASSLVVIGYLEKADNFCTWLSNFVEHITADEGDMIPPFRTKEMLNKAAESAEFAQANLYKWNPRRGGLMASVKTMQSKGTDLPLQTGSGEWIDEISHDNQYSSDEQMLMTAAFRNPVLMVINWGQVRTQYRIELLTARKEWLISKLIEVQSRERGMDINDPEYKKIKKATDKYASLISKYEQQIERMRG